MISIQTKDMKCGDCGQFNYGYCMHFRQSGYKKDRLACSEFTTKWHRDHKKNSSARICGYCKYYDEGRCLPKGKFVEQSKKGCNYWLSFTDGRVISVSDILALRERMKHEQRYRINQYYQSKSKENKKNGGEYV